MNSILCMIGGVLFIVGSIHILGSDGYLIGAGEYFFIVAICVTIEDKK